ncbi:methyltransferase [Sphingomonas sp. HITSZ_GF]|uniref:methyltransferase n=1 Tax=Sphingomonas sp. HITSZ_GF TaxID=3037247 RepID=UPI00240D08C9|nr:methyltransferase [Sphingomonas sp. HITSZ_GF]MDG2535226.1 methyltransferase [Sphingomonas sp. HITSZ_GF]
MAEGIDEIESGRAALASLLEALKVRGYRFVTPTPATHARVLARDPGRMAASLEDVLGWSRAFRPGSIDAEIETLLREAGALVSAEGGLKSRLRVSSLGDDLYLHSAYPTTERDAVFFGPDSYRFARLVSQELTRAPLGHPAHLVDIGAGAGVGAIVAARSLVLARATLTDINPAALALARVNAESAGVKVHCSYGPGLADLAGTIDLALANPPFLVDRKNRSYRDGGGMRGGALSVEMAAEALPRLAPGGRLILYTGSAIADGRDDLAAALDALAAKHGCRLAYDEIDPDIFGEELEREAYREVDRIAAVAAVFRREA